MILSTAKIFSYPILSELRNSSMIQIEMFQLAICLVTYNKLVNLNPIAFQPIMKNKSYAKLETFNDQI